MNTKEILKSVTNDFFAKNKNKVLFLSINSKLMDKISSLVDSDITIIDVLNDFEPYRPFFNILSQNKPPKSLIEKTSYPIQKDYFISYFDTGFCYERADFIITEERYYGKMRCHDTVVALLSECIKGNYLILNAQHMYKDSLDILDRIEFSDINAKFIFCFDIEEKLSDDNISNINTYLSEKSNLPNFFEISDLDMQTSSPINKTLKKLPSFEKLYQSLKNSRLLLSLSQATALSKWIIVNSEILRLDYMQMRQLYLEMAISSYLIGNMDDASFYLNNVLERQIEDELELSAIFYRAIVLDEKNAKTSSLKYINLLLRKIEPQKNPDLYAVAKMFLYRISDVKSDEYLLDLYKETRKLLKERNLINNYIASSLVMPGRIIETVEGRKYLLEAVDETIEAAKKLDNQFALSTAFHWKGIISSRTDNSNKCFKWYKKCVDIRTQIGESVAIIKVRNGLSYEYICRAEYKEGYELLNDYILHITEMNDYAEIIITLKNLGETLFFSRHFKEAYELYLKIISLMTLFEFDKYIYNIFMPTMNDIYIYKAFLDFYHGDVMRVRVTMNNILTNNKQFSPPTEQLVPFMKAVLALDEGDFESAFKHYQEFVDFKFEPSKQKPHQTSFMSFEFAATLQYISGIHKAKNNMELSKKYEDYANEYFEKAIEYAKKHELKYFLNDDEDYNVKKYMDSVKEFSKLNLNLRHLEENAEKDRLMNQLHKRLRDSQFLNSITSFNVDSFSENKYAENVCQTIFDYAMADAVYLAEKKDENWFIIASISRLETDPPNSKTWEDYYIKSQENRQSSLITKIENGNFYSNLSKYEFIGGMIIISNSNMYLTPETTNVLNIAITTLQSQMVMLKQNEHLLYISSTDQLSMLKNRRALQEQLSVQSEMIRRYEHKENSHFQVSIAFIDLDNFKFYNDTYGHEAGDLLIAKFSELLKRIYRCVDFIARFGGDEFVIILPNTTPEEGKRASERLQEGLEKDKYFLPDLENMIGQPLDIPENRLLGFSMGIAANSDFSDETEHANMEKTMINADHALYYSKNHGKKRTTLWKNIKDTFYEKVDEELEARTKKFNTK